MPELLEGGRCLGNYAQFKVFRIYQYLFCGDNLYVKGLFHYGFYGEVEFPVIFVLKFVLARPHKVFNTMAEDIIAIIFSQLYFGKALRVNHS